jgi:hypothetical protein
VSIWTRLDHIVIVADTLAQGVGWCEATLGVVPARGGEHPLMGTHNRLLRIASEAWPNAYLEIIAIDPAAPPPKHHRWFDMDDKLLQQAARERPRLAHFVAATPDAHGALKALKHLGIDRGALLHAERPLPDGVLRWQISVRPDGQRLFYGGLPTLIQWDGPHPADTLPDSGLALQSLRMTHPRPGDLAAAHAAIGLAGVELDEGPPNLVATLMTPKGVVTLESSGA